MVSSPLLSMLLLGAVPLWGSPMERSVLAGVDIAPPAIRAVQGSGASAFVFPERFSASGVLVIDLKSGQRLLAREADTPRPMASLTKIMTALIVAENHSMEEWVTVPASAAQVRGEVAELPPGQEFTVGDLLAALLMGSANDAAVTLALYHSGSIDAFVGEMNARAQELGLTNTSYANPVGFDAEGQFMSPQDIAWLTMYALRREPIRTRMGTRGVVLRSRGGTAIAVTHTHALIHAETGVIAGKTGTTEAARQCLISVVAGSDGREYLTMLLGSLDRYADMRPIIRVLTQ